MNIKVPYEKMGDIRSYAFVSLILDKKHQSVYRDDFVNGKNVKFFNREQLYVTVPDDVYEQCDSIIFFTFSKKTNSWTTKVIMWKNEDFVKFNSGYEYIRNAENIPDFKKIENWMYRAKTIRNTNKSIGKKNLIYFTLFGNNEYIFLQTELLKSLKANTYQNFDLLFITDSETKSSIRKIKELKDYNVYYHVVDGIDNPVDASMKKLKIYEWDNISNYKNILFLDSDMIVIGDVGEVFESDNLKNNVFYSATHNRNNSLHKTVYHCLIDYSEYQLQNFLDKDISAFNAGQFLFKNTSAMKSHFENINNFVTEWDGRYFFEQSFINYYFNLLEIADTKTFQNQFKFVSINENQTSNSFDKNAVFVHFMGNAGNGGGKLEFMKKHYSKILVK
jgi:hypothetical protein